MRDRHLDLFQCDRPRFMDVCCRYDVGRESWEWDGQESVVWQAPTCLGGEASLARESAIKIIVVVIVVIVVIVCCYCCYGCCGVVVFDAVMILTRHILRLMD